MLFCVATWSESNVDLGVIETNTENPSSHNVWTKFFEIHTIDENF